MDIRKRNVKSKRAFFALTNKNFITKNSFDILHEEKLLNAFEKNLCKIDDER